MEWILEEAIGEVIDEITTAVRTPGEQERLAAIVERLLESDVPIERWMGSGVAMALADQAASQYEAELEGRHWDVLVLGQTGETRAFHFVASEDVPGDFANLAREHGDVWGERLGSGCLAEEAALRIAEMPGADTYTSEQTNGCIRNACVRPQRCL